MPTINLVLWDNGVGLRRDMEILRDAWRAAGCDVFVSARRRGTLHKWLAPWRLKARMARQRFGGRDRLGRFDVNVMLEHIRPEHLDLAKRNVLIPNPEWFLEENRALLDRIDLVLVKTRHAQQQFDSLGVRTRFVGFTSIDRRMQEQKRKAFFHLAGRSRHKGTEELLRIWRKHPEWPDLTVLQHPRMAKQCVKAPNIDHRIGYISDAELKRLQNSHLFHLCPSETEGFGHYIVEAMSVGAIVLTLDAPPMNELVKPDRGVLLPYERTGTHGLSMTYHFGERGLQQAVVEALSLDDARCGALQANARRWFEENDKSFRLRLTESLPLEDADWHNDASLRP
ncbi:MAG TPA: glycosyltransferase [Steroidobacter sp.]|jgi:glycosyltransferase involved in cell wall biosynthesis|nr:glycosyltransferase [Steroidobacter sp.]